VDFLSKPVSVCLVAASVALYGASLVLPAFVVNGETERGWIVLILGWLDLIGLVVAPLAFPAWLANLCAPLTWVACLAGRRRSALITATIGLTLATALLLDPRIAISEAGGASPITAWRAGYFAWVGSFAIALICAWLTPSSTK